MKTLIAILLASATSAFSQAIIRNALTTNAPVTMTNVVLSIATNSASKAATTNIVNANISQRVITNDTRALTLTNTASAFYGRAFGVWDSTAGIYETISADDASFLFKDNVGNLIDISARTVYATAFAGSGSSLNTLNASALASGTVPTAREGSGTANNTTFLRGDQTWAVPAGGGGGTDPRFTSTAGTITSTSNTFNAPILVSRTNYVDRVEATNSSTLVLYGGGLEIDLTSSDATFIGGPYGAGMKLSDHSANFLTSGTVAVTRLPVTVVTNGSSPTFSSITVTGAVPGSIILSNAAGTDFTFLANSNQTWLKTNINLSGPITVTNTGTGTAVAALNVDANGKIITNAVPTGGGGTVSNLNTLTYGQAVVGGGSGGTISTNRIVGPLTINGDGNLTNGFTFNASGLVVSNALGSVTVQSGNQTNTGTFQAANVVITNAAAAPAALTINGNISTNLLTISINGAKRLQMGAYGTSATYGAMYLGSVTTPGNGNYNLMSDGSDTYVNSPVSGHIYFGVNNAFGGAYTTTGLGLGTLSPGQKLDVVGNAAISGTVTATNLVLQGFITTAVAPNMGIGYTLLTTNAAFTILAPVGVDTSIPQTTTYAVTNSTAAAVAITPHVAFHPVGTWFVTNVSEITIHQFLGRFTNAVCLPIW